MADKQHGLNAEPENVDGIRLPTGYHTKSGAAHSKSLGWVACVRLDIEHANTEYEDPQSVEIMYTATDARALAKHLIAAAKAAEKDLKAGVRSE